jgi:predicted ester cyclase
LDRVHEFYDRIWNSGDLGAVEKIVAGDFAFRGSLGAEIRGRAAFCAYVQSVRTPLKDYYCDILDCVSEGDKVFAKMQFSGVQVGEFRRYAPTGKRLHWLGAALFRVRGSMIVELWVLGDLISLEAQLQNNAAGA